MNLILKLFLIAILLHQYKTQNLNILDSLELNRFYNYSDYDNVKILPKGDNNYLNIQLETPINFYSEKYNQIYINTNGILTFTAELPDFINQPLPLEYPSIAVFYSNVDTTNSGKISFIKSRNSEFLSRSSDLIRNAFESAVDFNAKSVYVATWEKVGYYNGKYDKVNDYQVIIICSDDETYVQLIYPERGLNWLRADIGELGLPDIRAQAGFMSEDGRYFLINGSATEDTKYLNTISNVGVPGVWVYRVGPFDYQENIRQPDTAEAAYEPSILQNCADGLSKKCHPDAQCIDVYNHESSDRICCQCNEGFYGNGFSCIKNDVPIRVTGSITGIINGQRIDENAKLQSYIVMSDGRSYTAINPISAEFGQQLQLVLPIGSTIGWLFAKPVGDAKNGYQITGGKLNHTSILTFTETGDTFTVIQNFEGLNVWDQLTVNVELSGNLPNIPMGSKLQRNDYIEEYNYVTDTSMRSVSDQVISVNSDESEIKYGLEQIINFKHCKTDQDPDPKQKEPILQKVSKIILNYNDQEQAIRIGLLAKVGTNLNEDPCSEANCGENMVCLVDGDNYDCVCANGYEPDVTDRDYCVDIDECSSSNICHEYSLCINNAGGYQCKCLEGYYGNGFECAKSENNYPSLEDECARCSRDGICVEGQCRCPDGWDGDGYYCRPYCQQNDVWFDGRCIPQQSYPTNESPEYTRNGPPTQAYPTQEYPRQEYPTQEYPTVEYPTNSYPKSELPFNCNEQNECSCPDNYEYIEIENVCRYILYDSDRADEIPCDVDFNCHPEAKCVWAEHEYRHLCICPKGFKGDGYICTKMEDSCTTQPELCDHHASCIYNEAIGKSECHCDFGYEGDGFICQPAPDCKSDMDCNLNSYCNNGICVCLDGFERDLSDFCVLAGKCGGTYCANNAICKLEPAQKIQYCECVEGYIGDGVTSCKSIPPPCNVQNNCGLFATCLPSTEYRSKFECVCQPGYYGDGYVCVEEKNCRNTPNLCDSNAKCVQITAGDLTCVCNQGFIGNGTVCKEITTHESGFLLISQGVVIIRVPFSGKLIRPVTISSMAIGLDKDCTEGRVYWGDILNKKIMSAKYDGSDIRSVITENIESPEGIAVDWVSRRIYWADSNKDTIEVANLDNPSQRAVLINKYLVNPRGIAVDPSKQKLYWSDWNRENPKIEMANLDGTNREVLAQKPELVLPNSLVVLRNSGELCYADAGSHKIACIDVSSRVERQIIGNLSYPFGLSNTDDNFYWTDWNTKQIESVDIYGTRKTGIRTPFFGSHKMYGMTAITDNCPLMYNPCSSGNGLCPDNRLCLANNRLPSGKSCICTKLSVLCDNHNNMGFEDSYERF